MSVTLRDVAAAAGVSLMVASRAIGEKSGVSEDARNRVKQAARALGYRPTVAARALRTSRSRLIGLQSPTALWPAHQAVILGAHEAASASGYRLLLESDSTSADTAQPLQCDGYLMIVGGATPTVQTDPPPGGAPTVHIFNRLGEDADGSLVTVDFAKAASTATTHLIGRGFRRIALIAGPDPVESGKAVVRGYRRAVRDGGRPGEKRWVRLCDPNPDAVDEIVEGLFSDPVRPDGVYVGTVAHTPLVLEALAARNLRVGPDLGLVGTTLDQERPFLKLLAAQIPHIEIPAKAMGAAATRQVIGELEGQPRRRITIRFGHAGLDG